MTLKERFQFCLIFAFYGGIAFLEWVTDKLTPPRPKPAQLNFRKPIGEREWKGRPLDR
jgi:hypothetical protein